MKTLKKCNVTVMVRNMDNAIRFYTEKLGLELKARYENHYAEIGAGDFMMGLHPADSRVVYGNNLSIGFGVTNFADTVDHLQSNGVKLDIQKEGWNKIANFSDPDGNRLYVIEVK